MEAIAALSLACNVVQIVDTGIKLAEIIRQTYDRGSTENHEALITSSQHVQSLTRGLNKELSKAANGKPPSSTDATLAAIAVDCQRVSTKLIGEVENLKSGGGRRDAFIKGFRTWRRKDEIEKLKVKLQDHERTMNTGVLLSLRQQSLVAHAAQTAEFSALDTVLQHFIRDVAQGQLTCADLVRQEHSATRQLLNDNHISLENQIDTRLGELQLEMAARNVYTQFIGSLRYSEMNERLNQIVKNSEDTFDWIFDEEIVSRKPKTFIAEALSSSANTNTMKFDAANRSNNKSKQNWSSFSQWLAEGKGVYWIQGKAGSGKSTLMKFIMEHEATKSLLHQWIGTRKLLYLRYGFWLSGTPRQRNMLGLLCALLYQTVHGNIPLVEHLCNSNPNLADKNHIEDWSVLELNEALKAAMSYSTAVMSVCVFIDGLDELDRAEDPLDLMRLITNLTSQEHVKCVVSSRAENFWITNLNKKPQLKLQDITAPDIEKYVKGQLNNHFTTRETLDDKEMKQDLVRQIVLKADGVFLWVRIAVKALLRGLAIEATISELEARLNQLPPNIEDLYQAMFSRTGDDWQVTREEAALYFHICLASQQFDPSIGLPSGIVLTHYVHCEYSWRHQWCKNYTAESIREFKAACLRVEARIPEVCFGMLELRSSSSGSEPFFSRRIQFCHRTAKDWLLDKPAGREITAALSIGADQLYRDFIQGDMTCYDLGLQNLDWNSVQCLVRFIKSFRKREEAISDDTLAELLQKVEQTITEKTHLPTDIDELPMIKGTDPKSGYERNRQHQFLLHSHLRRKHSSNTGDWVLPFDILGLSLTFGLTSHLETLPGYTTSPLSYLRTLSDVYREYLFLCTLEGLEGMLRIIRKWHDKVDDKDFAILSSLARQLLDVGVNTACVAYIPVRQKVMLRLGYQVYFCLRHATPGKSLNECKLTKYLTKKPIGPSQIPSYVEQRSVDGQQKLTKTVKTTTTSKTHDDFEVYVEIDFEDYFGLVISRMNAQPQRTSSSSVTGAPRIIWIDVPRKANGRTPTDAASNSMLEHIFHLMSRRQSYRGHLEYFAVEEERINDLRQLTENCMDALNDEGGAREEVLTQHGFWQDTKNGYLHWRELIPMFTSSSKDEGAYSKEAHADPADSDSDDDSFKSFEE